MLYLPRGSRPGWSQVLSRHSRSAGSRDQARLERLLLLASGAGHGRKSGSCWNTRSSRSGFGFHGTTHDLSARGDGQGELLDVLEHEVPGPGVRPRRAERRSLEVLVAVGDPGDADDRASDQLAVADRAADQREAQGGPVDGLARVQQHPAGTPPAGPVLHRLGTGEDAGRVRLPDADAADPVALGQRRDAHAARPHTAVPGRPARRPLIDATVACCAAARTARPECLAS